MQKWDVIVNGNKHEIIYEGSKMSGKARIRVDGISKTYAPVFVKNIGMFYFIDIEESELILKLVHDGPQGLAQDGVYLETGLPLEEDAVEGFRAALESHDPLTARNKAAMGSFLTFVILTFVNMLLIAMDAPFSFPFSATVPQVLFGLGWYPLDFMLPVPQAALIAAAFICVIAYLLLYILARKRTWPVLTALILVAIDTALLIYLSIGDFTTNIIDIAFHAWVLWSVIQLYRTRLRINKEAAQRNTHI